MVDLTVTVFRPCRPDGKLDCTELWGGDVPLMLGKLYEFCPVMYGPLTDVPLFETGPLGYCAIPEPDKLYPIEAPEGAVPETYEYGDKALVLPLFDTGGRESEEV